jgi:hypothetical protein
MLFSCLGTGIQDKRHTHFGLRHSAPVAPLRMRGGGENLEIPKKIKWTYFNIEGAAEKVRLAFSQCYRHDSAPKSSDWA